MGRIPAEQIAERLQATAEAMTRLRSTGAVCKAIGQRFGVDQRTVMSWIRKVRQARRSEASELDRDEARDQIRHDLNQVVQLALNKTITVKNDDGTVALKADGTPVVRSSPDLGRAIHALRELTHLDGLAEPMRAEVKIESTADRAPDVSNLKPDQVRAGLEFIAKLGDGDVARIVGDQFRLSGSRPRAIVDDEDPAPAAAPTPED